MEGGECCSVTRRHVMNLPRSNFLQISGSLERQNVGRIGESTHKWVLALNDYRIWTAEVLCTRTLDSDCSGEAAEQPSCKTYQRKNSREGGKRRGSESSALLRQDIPGYLDPVFEVLFGKYMTDVVFNSADTEPEIRSDFFIT